MNFQEPLSGLFERIARAIERLGPRLPESPDFGAADAFVWQAETEGFLPVARVNRLPLALLKGIDRARDALLENTRRFAGGLPANNALLWGARGMGKSSLVKAVHGEIAGLTLVEIHREDIASLPHLLAHLREAPSRRFILFCDDLSFEAQDTAYKSLKAVLEGGIEGRPDNVLFYATSNRRHLMPREMVDNERSTAIHPGEAVEEKLSLSDRFGIRVVFPSPDQRRYLAVVEALASQRGLRVDPDMLRRRALQWADGHNGRSGRTARQFVDHLEGELGLAARADR